MVMQGAKQTYSREFFNSMNKGESKLKGLAPKGPRKQLEVYLRQRHHGCCKAWPV